MSSKKTVKAREAKRHAALAHKAEQRRLARDKRWRIAAIVAAIAIGSGLVALIAVAIASGRTAASQLSASASASPSAPGVDLATGWAASPAPPDSGYAEGRTWKLGFTTNRGTIVMELDGEAAPQATASFVQLAREAFFDGTDCHRLTTDIIFVLQCGDPFGTGSGGPSYRFGPIENAPADNVYPAGTVAMARVSGDAGSMGSQFFIVYKDSTIPSDAAGGYTVVGHVTDGLAIVEGVAKAGTITSEPDGRPAVSVIITEVSVS